MKTSGKLTPTSRQKSCDLCVRGKRKCGKERPSCTRCVISKTRCTYRGIQTLTSISHQNHTQQSPGLVSNIPIFDLFSPEMAPYLGGFDESVVSSTEAPVALEDMLSCLKSTTMPRDRVKFCVQQFTSYPKMLITQNKTPFIHPQLYNDVPMPQAIQDIYCICALYLNKTEVTTDNIFRILDSKSSQLLEPHPNWSISDNLSCLQALCVYQILRLFDGDIRQRAVAEQQESYLVDWTCELLRRTQPEQASISQSWVDWVFAESVRRTILMSLMIQGVYAVIKQGFCYCSESVARSPFTASTALWNAPTAYDWEKAYREKEHFSIKNMTFGDVLSNGSASEIDDLGILMMVTFLGPDQVREWVNKSGSELVAV